MDEAQLKTLKVAELKELLTKANLPTTGVKTELIARLLAHQPSKPTEPPTPAVPTPSEPAPATPAKTDDAPVAAAEAKAPETTQADIDAELQKRKDRAARFGITQGQGEDEEKRLERQKRFGNAVEADTTAKSLSKLDQPLAERRRKGKRGQQEGAEAAAPATAAAPTTATAAAKPASVKQTQTEEEIEKKRKRAERFGLATDDNAKKQKV